MTVFHFEDLNLSNRCRCIVRDMAKCLRHVNQDSLTPRQRAYISLLHHLTEMEVLAEDYVREKVELMFSEW